MWSSKYLFLLENHTQFLRQESELLGVKEMRVMTYTGNILCQAPLEKNEVKIVLPSGYSIRKWPSMQVTKSQLVSRPPHPTTPIPYRGTARPVSQWNLRTLKVERKMAGGKYFIKGHIWIQQSCLQRGTYFTGLLGFFLCVCVYGIAEKEGFFIFGVDVFRTEHSTLSPLSPPVFAFCSNLIRRQRGLQTFITQDPKSIEFSIRDKRDRVPMSSHAMPQNTREQSSRYKAYRSLHSSRWF